MTEQDIIRLVKQGPGCEITAVQMAELWADKEEKDCLQRYTAEHERRDWNVRMSLHGIQPLPTLTDEQFTEVKELADLARQSVIERMNAFARKHAIVAAPNTITGGAHFFDETLLAHLAADESGKRRPEEF